MRFWFLIKNVYIKFRAKTQNIRKKSVICKAFGQNLCISSVFGLNSKLSICKVCIPEGSIPISRPCCRSISKKNYYKELFEVIVD